MAQQGTSSAVAANAGATYRTHRTRGPTPSTSGGIAVSGGTTGAALTEQPVANRILYDNQRLASLKAEREKKQAEKAAGTPAPTSSAHVRLSGRRLNSAKEAPPVASQAPTTTTAAGAPTGVRSVGGVGARIPVTRPAGAPGGASAGASAGAGAGTGASTGTGTGAAPGAGAAATTSTSANSDLRTLPTRRPVDALSNPVSRRPSKLVIDKEKKTDYWRDVEKKAQEQGAKLNPDDLNNVISRAMSLGIVGDKKQRESLSGPDSQELLQQLKSSMERRLVELNGGRQINFESLVPTGNTSTMEKILSLEKALSALEQRKTKEEEEEKKRVQNKISELEKTLKALEAQKVQQREQNRRTMKLEIANLKEMMEKVQKEKSNEAQAAAEAKAMAAKMSRLEAALRLLNDDRKKGQADDKDTLLLKRKLALFEQKLAEMEAEKKMREEQDQSGVLRDKLLLMENKLEKMEKRKSMSMTLQMQAKMEEVEKQLAVLRNERNLGHNDSTNTKITQKMAILEKQLQTMAQQKFTPAMVQDEETVALRDHIKKLEEQIILQEKRMEEQRLLLEEDRRRNYERRMAEEEAFKQQTKAKEEEMLNRLQAMDMKLKQGFAAGGGGGQMSPEVLEKLKQMAVGGGPDVAAKLQEMERRLLETQQQLEKERKTTADLFALAPKSGPELEKWQENLQLSILTKSHEALVKKIDETNKEIEAKMKAFDEKLKSGAFVMGGGGGGGAVSKSGLTFAEINAKLAEIQSKLFGGDIDERESENLNIEYEKLITELEGTPEYQKEQEETRNKWKKDNEAPNKEAFEKVYASLKGMEDTKLTAVFKRKPELKFILRTTEQILKAHVNDFKQVSTQNLLLIEARALYHIMPAFRKDQEQQQQFVQQLQQKIEIELAKTPAPPPIKPAKKVVIKTKKGGGGGGDFLAELLQKRKVKE